MLKVSSFLLKKVTKSDRKEQKVLKVLSRLPDETGRKVKKV